MMMGSGIPKNSKSNERMVELLINLLVETGQRQAFAHHADGRRK